MLRTPALIISVAALAAVAGCARQTPLAERLAEESRRDASPREKADVILVSHNEKKIQVIRVVREITGLGLEDAKALVESAPAPVKRGVYQDEAKQIRKKLEAVGATVEVRW